MDAKTGKQLWSYGRLGGHQQPFARPSSAATTCSPRAAGTRLGLLKLIPAAGDGVEAEEVYLLEPGKMATNSGGAVLAGTTCTPPRPGRHPAVRRAINRQAEVGEGCGPGIGPAAVVSAGGMLYFQYESGVVARVAATPEKYQLKGQFRTPGTGRSLAHPAISGGKLYLRDHDALYCYDLRKK